MIDRRDLLLEQLACPIHCLLVLYTIMYKILLVFCIICAQGHIFQEWLSGSVQLGNDLIDQQVLAQMGTGR